MINNIPIEIFLTIINYVNEADMVTSSFVCKKWNKIITKEISELSEYKEDYLEYIALDGYFNLLKWAVKNGYKCKGETYMGAAYEGHLEILKWLKNRKYKCNAKIVCKMASEKGYLEIVKWLDETDDLSHCECAIWAAKGAQIKILEWLKETDDTISYDAYISAAKHGNLNILQWLKRNKCYYESSTLVDAFDEAIYEGHLEVLRWLKRNGCPRAERISNYNYYRRSYELQSLFEETKFRGRPIDYAAKKGYLEVLKWLHKNDYDFDKRTYWFAASKGQLEVVRWLRSIGCQWTKNTYLIAKQKQHLDVVQWLEENGCPR